MKLADALMGSFAKNALFCKRSADLHRILQLEAFEYGNDGNVGLVRYFVSKLWAKILCPPTQYGVNVTTKSPGVCVINVFWHKASVYIIIDVLVKAIRRGRFSQYADKECACLRYRSHCISAIALHFVLEKDNFSLAIIWWDLLPVKVQFR